MVVLGAAVLSSPCHRLGCQAMRRNCHQIVKTNSVLGTPEDVKINGQLVELADGFSQFTPQNLSGGGLRDGVDEMDLARLLVVSEAVGDEDAEFVSELVAGEKAVAEGDEGNRNFSRCVVGPTNDSPLFPTRSPAQHRFP